MPGYARGVRRTAIAIRRGEAGRKEGAMAFVLII